MLTQVCVLELVWERKKWNWNISNFFFLFSLFCWPLLASLFCFVLWTLSLRTEWRRSAVGLCGMFYNVLSVLFWWLCRTKCSTNISIMKKALSTAVCYCVSIVQRAKHWFAYPHLLTFWVVFCLVRVYEVNVCVQDFVENMMSNLIKVTVSTVFMNEMKMEVLNGGTCSYIHHPK